MAKKKEEGKLKKLGKTEWGSPKKGHCRICGMGFYKFLKDKTLCPNCDKG